MLKTAKVLMVSFVALMKGFIGVEANEKMSMKSVLEFPERKPGNNKKLAIAAVVVAAVAGLLLWLPIIKMVLWAILIVSGLVLFFQGINLLMEMDI